MQTKKDSILPSKAYFELRAELLKKFKQFIELMDSDASVRELERLREDIREMYHNLEEQERSQIKVVLGDIFPQHLSKIHLLTRNYVD